MTIKSFKRITTADTKKSYELPGDDVPQIWAIQIQIEHVGGRGDYSFPSSFSEKKEIFLERRTLENAGLKPMCRDRIEMADEPTETAEDLIIRLLEHLGYYPTE